MIKIEKVNIVNGLNIFSISGDVENIKNGYTFSFENRNYKVDSVAMMCNKENVNMSSVEVVASCL